MDVAARDDKFIAFFTRAGYRRAGMQRWTSPDDGGEHALHTPEKAVSAATGLAGQHALDVSRGVR